MHLSYTFYNIYKTFDKSISEKIKRYFFTLTDIIYHSCQKLNHIIRDFLVFTMLLLRFIQYPFQSKLVTASITPPHVFYLSRRVYSIRRASLEHIVNLFDTRHFLKTMTSSPKSTKRISQVFTEVNGEVQRDNKRVRTSAVLSIDQEETICSTPSISTSTETKKSSMSNPPIDLSTPNNTTLPTNLHFSPPPEGCWKISTWNVCSLNAAIKKGFRTYVDAEQADIICLQETKVNSQVQCVDDKIYKYRYWAYEEKKGYAGTAIFSKHKPIEVQYGMEGKHKGRVITLEFKGFYLVACYVTNSGAELVRLPERRSFNVDMEKYIRTLESKGKGVVWTGDLNVAHTPIDLARPKTNQKSACFTPEERADFTKILGSDLPLPHMIDAWRYFHPKTCGHYSFFSYRFKCREKRLGWRLDYFVLSSSLLPKLRECEIRLECYGASDHVPVVCIIDAD